jgi:outer membrane protein OmpA-like peptidoglycan-associated protein
VNATDWAKHCSESRSCEGHAEEVPRFHMDREKIKWAALGFLCVLLILALIAALTPDPLHKAIEQSRADLARLDQHLTDLESKPRPDPYRALMEESRELVAKAQHLTQEINKINAGETAEDFQRWKVEIEQEKQQLEGLRARLAGPVTGPSDIVTDAKTLVRTYQDLEAKVEPLRRESIATAKEQFRTQAEALLNQMKSGISKALRLERPFSISSYDQGRLSDLFRQTDSALLNATNQLDRLRTLPKPPFLEEQATLRISATSDLAETLILPLLRSKSGGAIIQTASGDWYYQAGSTDRIIVRAASADAFDALNQKKCDLLFTDREPTLDESEAFSASFGGAKIDSHSTGQVVALDALTLLCNPENVRTSVGPADLESSQEFIGGEKGSPERLAADRFGFHVDKATPELPADEVLHETDAIGLGIYHREGANIRAKRLAWKAGPTTQELKPSPFTIATEDYRFSFRIMAWNFPEAKPEAIDFVRFITSPAGQQTVSEQGYVDLRLRALPINPDPRVLAALSNALKVKAITGAQRLSTDFRFSINSDRLDLKAQGDLEALPTVIARDFAHAKVVILGFTDNTGGAVINGTLSERRAEAIAVALRKSGMELSAAGMGSLFPVDDNGTEEGKARNRRSEVWIVTL